MSTYIKPGKPLEFDNAPEWLIAYMRYRRTVLGNTPTSVLTYFKALREFFQWYSEFHRTGTQPRSAAALRQIQIYDMPVSEALAVTKNDIETYLYFATDVLGNSANSRCKKLTAIHSFYEYLIDQQDASGFSLAVNPAARIRHPKLPKKQPIYLPEADQEALLSSISGENGCRDYAIFLLFLTTGLRISELTGINLADVSLDAHWIRIRGKGNKERFATLTPACTEAIRTYLEQYRALIQGLNTDALFVSRRYKDRLTPRAIEKAMQIQLNRAKLGGLKYTPHKLRHTTATSLARDGVDLLVIQKVLGHENPGTTEIYTHMTNADIAKVLNTSSLSRLGNPSVGPPKEGD